MAADDPIDSALQHFKELDLAIDQSTASPLMKTLSAAETGLITIDGLVSIEFIQQLLRILQQHEASTGRPLNATGLELWDAEYQVIFQKIGDRLWEVLKSSDLSNKLRKALDIEDAAEYNPLTVVDGYAIRYISPQDLSEETYSGQEVDSAHPAHTDDCSLTLNLCLGVEEFTGGELQFEWEYGQKKMIAEHKIGTAIVHPGKLAHSALPMTSGTRYNLVIWFESLSRHARAEKIGTEVLKELAETERMYLEVLNSLRLCFSEANSLPKEVAELSALIESMKTFHSEVLKHASQLVSIAHSPSFSGPEKHPEFLEALRAIRTLFLHNAHVYVDYCKLYGAVVALLGKSEKARNVCAKLDPEFHPTRLCYPVRRICKYPLLFRELDKCYNRRYHLTYSLAHTPRLEEVRHLYNDVQMAVQLTRDAACQYQQEAGHAKQQQKKKGESA